MAQIKRMAMNIIEFIVFFLYQFNKISKSLANLIKTTQNRKRTKSEIIAEKLIKAREKWKKKLNIAKSADKGSTKQRAPK